MQGYPISFNIYAESPEEVAEARAAIVDFIDGHAREGRAVTGRKVARALRSLPQNPYIRNSVIEFLKNP